jgi:hypothetical protein
MEQLKESVGTILANRLAPGLLDRYLPWPPLLSGDGGRTPVDR